MNTLLIAYRILSVLLESHLNEYNFHFDYELLTTDRTVKVDII